MSLIPEFELGLWNAWILVIPVLIFSFVGYRILGKRGSGGVAGRTSKEKMLESIGMLVIFAFYAYSFFLPLKLGTSWFYGGLLIYLIGLFFEFLAMLSFRNTPLDEPVIKGVYSVSRNPMYIGDFFVNVGISIACLSWIFLLLAITIATLYSHSVANEERICLNQYGDAYREYMKRTPRWIGKPKSEKRE
jgi:protein-S-isoprenylcysteine O-methyltransferase Ste14